MNAFRMPVEPRVRARYSGDHDHILSCDTVPPNRHHQRRTFFAIVVIVCVAAAVALIGATLQGFDEMTAAFPHLASLFDASAWDCFFSGFGRLGALVFVLLLMVMVVRRRRRRTGK